MISNNNDEEILRVRVTNEFDFSEEYEFECGDDVPLQLLLHYKDNAIIFMTSLW